MAEIEYYILGTGILNQANRKGFVENSCLLIISKKWCKWEIIMKEFIFRNFGPICIGQGYFPLFRDVAFFEIHSCGCVYFLIVLRG